MHYSNPYRHYSQLFGIPERSIKRWVAIGKRSNPPDLPPFDAPAELPAWWNRHMSQRHPAWLTAFIAAKQPKSDANDASDKINVQENANPLEQAKKHLAIADRRLNAALNEDPPDEGRIGHATRIWQDTLEVYLKAKRAEEEEQRIRGQWISRSEISEEVLTLVEHLRQMKTNLARRVASALSQFFNNDQLQQIQSAVLDAQSNQDAILRRFESMAAHEQETAWDLELAPA